MSRKIVCLLAAIFIIPVTITPSFAYATSVYDSNYTTIDSLFYGDVNYYGINCPMQDMSGNFFEIFSNPDYWVYAGEYDAHWSSLEDSIENGSVAVSVQQHRMDTGYDANLNLFWNPNGGEISFQGDHVVVSHNDTKYAQLYMRQDLLGNGGCVPAIRVVYGGGPIATNPGVDTSTTANGFYTSNYYASGWTVTYPTNYEGTPIREVKPRARYVAMGDSYSSGEGNLPYEYGSDSMANACHRSSNAYPRLVQRTLSLGSTAFVACSGAVSDYIIDSHNLENVEPPQAVQLSDETEIVTISLGGNDIGFLDVLQTCIASSAAQTCESAIDTARDKVEDPDFLSDITDVLDGIRSLTGPATNVIVLGYPHIFPEYENISGNCTWGTYAQHILAPNKVSNRTITESEIDALREVHDILNNVISAAVVNTSDSHVDFVDPSVIFEDHEVCGNYTPWINSISLTLNNSDIASGSYHPNQDGQAALAVVIEAAIANLN